MTQLIYPFRTSLLHLNLMRFATPYNCTDGAEIDFKDDAQWLSKHKHRQQVIRKASFSEFGTFDVFQQCGGLGLPQPPQLWTLVIRTGTENHIIIPVWLGEPCFPTDNSIRAYDVIADDNALQLILHSFNHQQGFDALNLYEWQQRVASSGTQHKSTQGPVN